MSRILEKIDAFEDKLRRIYPQLINATLADRDMPRVYTMARIEAACAMYYRCLKDGPGKAIETHDLEGNLITVNSGMTHRSRNQALRLLWSTYQQLSDSGNPVSIARRDPWWLEDTDSKQLLPLQFRWQNQIELRLDKTFTPSPKYTAGPDPRPEFEAKLKDCDDLWTGSRFMSHIQGLMHSGIRFTADSVVCFGAGILGSRSHIGGIQEETIIRDFVLHNFIHELRYLNYRLGFYRPVTVKIHQPMHYKMAEGELDAHRAINGPITGATAENFVDDFEAFTSITQNTLVISMSPEFCVRQILADICPWDTDFEYPVAILCNTVKSREKYEPDMCDPSSPRVEELVRHYNAYSFTRDHSPRNWNLGDLTLYVRRNSPIINP